MATDKKTVVLKISEEEKFSTLFPTENQYLYWKELKKQIVRCYREERFNYKRVCKPLIDEHFKMVKLNPDLILYQTPGVVVEPVIDQKLKN
jgi:hypothetical protein